MRHLGSIDQSSHVWAEQPKQDFCFLCVFELVRGNGLEVVDFGLVLPREGIDEDGGGGLELKLTDVVEQHEEIAEGGELEMAQFG